VLIEPEVQYPLAWYLRDVPGVRYAPVADNPNTPIAVARREGDPRPLEGYRSEAHALRATRVRPALDPGGLWKWFVARTSDRPQTVEFITLYIRR
jgi:hypothetical protein